MKTYNATAPSWGRWITQQYYNGSDLSGYDYWPVRPLDYMVHAYTVAIWHIKPKK